MAKTRRSSKAGGAVSTSSDSGALAGIPADKTAASPDKGGPNTSRATASSPLSGKRRRGAVVASNTADDLAAQVRSVFEERESDVPVELRVKAAKIVGELSGLDGPSALDEAISQVRNRPFLGKTGFLFNARDEDYTIQYDSRSYLLPADAVTEVPIGVFNLVGPGVGHLFYGIVQVWGDETDGNARRNARDEYISWLSRMVAEKVGKYRDARNAAIAQGFHAPAPDPDTAFFMLKAKQYQHELRVA